MEAEAVEQQEPVEQTKPEPEIEVIYAPEGAERIELTEFGFPLFVKEGEAFVKGQPFCQIRGSSYNQKRLVLGRPGIVLKIHVESGAQIKEGDPLFTVEYTDQPPANFLWAPDFSWQTKARRNQTVKRGGLPDDVEGSETEITSPIEGVFYRAESPTSRPFIEVGETIERGQTVCIIEAMKCFNEIVYEGRNPVKVLSIELENNKVVKEGTVLIKMGPIEDKKS